MVSPTDSSLPEGLIDVRAVRLVEGLPLDLSTEQVMAQLDQQQLSLSLEQVQTIRGRERARAQARARVQEPTLEETTMNEMSQEPDPVGEEEREKPAPAAGREGVEGLRRGRKPGGTDTKAGYVRSLPLEVSAKQVVEQARGQGFEMSEGYVYAIRAKLKQPKGVVRPKTSKAKASVQPTSPRNARAMPASPSPPPEEPTTSPPVRLLFTRPSDTSVQQVELELARLVMEVGIIRAEHLLSQLKERLSSLLSPL